mgnify:CR=1 FL=1
MNDQKLALRVAARFLAEYKEKPQTKKKHITDKIREVTGVSVGIAKDIADKLVAKKGDIEEILRLALQKGWPVNEDGILEGSKGSLDLASFAV